MPYKIYKKPDGKYGVKNKDTGKVHTKGTTKAKAEAQVRLMRGVEHGWEPTDKSSAKGKQKKGSKKGGKHKGSKPKPKRVEHEMPEQMPHEVAAGFMR